MSQKARILIYDLEVSTLRVEAEVYGLKMQTPYLNHQDITRDYAIHGAAWKWLGDETTHCVSVSSKDPFDDRAVVKQIYDLVNEADIVVGHNINRFDMRKLNARALKHGLPPAHKVVTIDTLSIARRYFDIPSNSLAYLAKFLEVGVEKDESPDWAAIRSGCPEALSYMREYNKRDVDVTERVYLKLRGFDHSSPNVAKIQRITDVSGNIILCCPSCGSVSVVKNGTYPTRNMGRQNRMMCMECGKQFKGQKS